MNQPTKDPKHKLTVWVLSITGQSRAHLDTSCHVLTDRVKKPMEIQVVYHNDRSKRYIFGIRWNWMVLVPGVYGTRRRPEQVIEICSYCLDECVRLGLIPAPPDTSTRSRWP